MQMALYVFLQTIKPYIVYSISSQTEKSKADETIESAKTVNFSHSRSLKLRPITHTNLLFY